MDDETEVVPEDPTNLGALVGADPADVQAHHEKAAADYGPDFGALADEIQGDQPRTIETRAALAGMLRALGEGSVDLSDHRDSLPLHVDRESAARAAGSWEARKFADAASKMTSDSGKEIAALWTQAQKNANAMEPEDQQRLADFQASFANASQGVLKPGAAAAGMELAEVDAVPGGARLVFHAPTVPPAVAANVSDTAVVEPSGDTTPAVIREPDGTLSLRAEPTSDVKAMAPALRPVGALLNPAKAVQWVPAQPRPVDWVDSVVENLIADAGDTPVSMTVRLAPAQPIRPGNRLVVDIDASNPRLAKVIEESVGKPATTEKGGLRQERSKDGAYTRKGVATVVFDLGDKATRAEVSTAWGLALAAAQDVQSEVAVSAYLTSPDLAPPASARVAEHHFVDKAGRCLAVRSGDDDVANENLTYAWVPKAEAAKLGRTDAPQLQSRRDRVVGRESDGVTVVDNEVRLVVPDGDVKILQTNVLASTRNGQRMRHAAVYLPPGEMPTVVLGVSADDVAATDGRVVMVHLGTNATLEVPEVNGNPDNRLAYEADAVLRRLGAKLPPGRVTIRAKAAE